MAINKCKKGDCFAYKIENDEEYKGRYLILIATELNTSNNGTGSPNEKYFRCKITKNNTLPTTKEEIDSLDYILVSTTEMEMRFFPLDGNRLSKELIEERGKVKVYPDENGYLYTYTFGINLRISQLNSLIYLGQFNIDLPKHEFIPFDLINLDLFSLKHIENILNDYRGNNLKQYEYWSHNREQMKKYNKSLLKDIIDLEKH